MTNKTLGYCPVGAPGKRKGSNITGIYPFDKYFNESVDLSSVKTLQGVDAVVLWGGADISPSLYKHSPYYNSGPANPSHRDLFEWEVLRQAHEKKIPIIGVCRGAQMACAFAGAPLIQHVNGHNYGSHGVLTYDGERHITTSAHHQMMFPYDIEHVLLAWSAFHISNGYYPETKESAQLEKKQVLEPEAVYFPEINAIGIQGHPEWTEDGDPYTDWFINQCEMWLYK